MVNKVTRTKDFASEEWVNFKGPPSFRTFQHYRLVLQEVGRPLQAFRNVRELIQVFRDALHAHRLAHDMANILHRDISAGNIMITEEERGLLVDWDLSKSLDNPSDAPSPPERMGTWQFMAARLILESTPGTPPPIPNCEDDLESFWHVLLWITLRHCDHHMAETQIVHTLGLLFDIRYIGATGQAQGGQSKLASLTSQSSITQMNLGNEVLNTILVDTAEVLATRYPSRKTRDGILQVQKMWEQLNLEISTLDSDLLISELSQQIIKMFDWSLLRSYVSWNDWRTMQDDTEWMEKIFENALKDPSADWNQGNTNIQRILPRPKG